MPKPPPRCGAALDQLSRLLRDGYNFIQGLGSFAISDAERIGLFVTYGWESGKIGEFTDARIESLAIQALAASTGIANPAHRYPTALLNLITTQLDIVNLNQPLATGGSAQLATDVRDAAVDVAAIGQLARAVLLLLGQRRHRPDRRAAPGSAASRVATRGRRNRNPLPGEPGIVMFDEASLTLTAPEMPQHATSVRAYRRPMGGEAELAGTSTTTTVSIVASSPLTPGVTYELWLVGHNSQGDGPESTHFTHMAMPEMP